MSRDCRALAAQCCYQVIDQGRSLSDVLPKAQLQLTNPLDKALLQEICFGVMRTLPQLEHVCARLMQKPLVKNFRVLQFLIYVGIYQLHFMRVPDHAAINATVDAARELKGQSLTKLINGVLRNVQRQPELFDFSQAGQAVQFNHPGWLISGLQSAYPDDWQQILDANQQKAPLWLRVNNRQISTEQFCAALADEQIAYSQPIAELPSAVLLDNPTDVITLPGYQQGWFSVQDAAAQYAGWLLAAENDHRVLDACCAPGGKTSHLLELADGAKLTALDKDPARLVRVTENLQRLQLSATVLAADAANPDSWWDGQLFDRILLDVPCSATGVIRRHPDIRWLRKKSDIGPLVQLQQQILQQCWALLAPGGKLLYATCSVLPAENQQQMTRFLTENTDAVLLPTVLQNNQTMDSTGQPGWQLLPGQQNRDGFYYALLQKAPQDNDAG
ncbi:16S rRNA (cytosine(967)-C(5))-methyltransferase RsmB [Arsukibacterium sp.]|uniref:16S rRNA (cytosine(967)-C(5))-methyltransferase RsmB n=1 Tax=Arsukibacterium sp. TaxID=1977258 RepID=UPI00299E6C7F|nr:16S rRNA (cytosine(967)-C(5))-methyltransferase RsmB [Arsukibacterium sp.]MDX1537410.1 16S rRNA (cytosine(967)-C(5))-methyltransferase RsmB [Arsukibacterium sp.]